MYMSRIKTPAVSTWEHPVAAVAGGKLRGVAKDGGFIFRGVPYASARRFMPPREVTYEDCLFLADHYTCVCPELLTPVPAYQYLAPRFFLPQDEDCLNLDLWTPTLDPQAKKPVLIWFGEGDWLRGGANELFASDGENLSRERSLVVVAVNHRVNCLGSLELSSFGGEYAGAGRLCLLDMLAAARWVHENIAAFGGDPGCVTLYGHGAGGQKVYALMQMPQMDGLYHRVAVGSAVPEPGTAPEDAMLMTRLVMENCHARTPEPLLEMDYWYLAEAVLDAMERYKARTGRNYTWAPAADGDIFPGMPEDMELRAETVHIPMLLGSSFGEGDSSAYGERTQPDGPGAAACFMGAYPGRDIQELKHMDHRLRRRLLQFIAGQAAAGRNIWNYLFDLNVEFKKDLTAWRGSELPYFFCNADYLESSFLPDVTPRLQAAMSLALGSFCAGGSPDGGAFPDWGPAGAYGVPTMIFGKDTRCAVDFDRELQMALEH